MTILFRVSCVVLAMTVSVAGQSAPSAIVESKFTYEKAPYPSAHASTIAHTRDGLSPRGSRHARAHTSVALGRVTRAKVDAVGRVAGRQRGTRHPC